MATATDLTDRLKAEGRRLGFDQVGVAPAVAPPGYPSFLAWLEAGRAAGMDYLQRGAEARSHPDRLLEGVRSVVVTSFVYGRPDPGPLPPNRGKVARYAQGQDYHPLLWRRLEALLEWLRSEHPGANGRAVCDTAPLLERDFAKLAGLGWIGKNTMVIDRRLGSFTVLGALLVDVELEPDAPVVADHCGTCTRCLDACPTDALVAPGILDANRCLSYWTIEHRGLVPEAIAERLDGWAFGCDICQDVCPWNRKAPAGTAPELQPVAGRADADLIDWLTRDPAGMKAELRTTALSRAKPAGLARNAALVLGERRDAWATPALGIGLGHDDPAVRAASAWALGRIGGDAAVEHLRSRREDTDPHVRGAVARALEAAGDPGGGPPESGG